MTEADTPTKGERTRQIILDAAERLILSQGYNGTSMRQIAQEAGVALGGIYNHFASKEAIFAALLERHQPYSDIVAGINSLSDGSATELADRAARMAVNEMLEDPIFFQLALIDMLEFEGDTLMQFVSQIVPALLSLVTRIHASGQMRQDIPLPVMMRAFGGMIVFYVLSELIAFRNELPWFQLPVAHDIDWIGGMVEIYMNGVLKRGDS
jgi:AcrR family transcriptional regulator